jgi:hypothetical protein
MLKDSYKNPKAGKTYISPSLPEFGSEQKIRIASKVVESPDAYAFAMVKDEIVLRHREGAKIYVKAKFLEDDRRIFVLSIQNYSVAAEKPYNASFSFVGDEITKLLEFIHNISNVTLKGSGSVNIADEGLRRLVLSDRQARSLVQQNEDLFAEVVRSSITKQDVVAVGYRKKQLDVFRQLVDSSSYFDSLRERKSCTDEALWQQFFEKNPWIFGYGLNYVYLSTLDDKKLEQVVQGHHVGASGKRVDGLMKTKGLISSLCFVEIKTNTTALLRDKPYRAECWAPSNELAGAVSQVQGTVASATATLKGKLELTDSLGNPTGEEAFNYQPRAFLVIGNLREFVSGNGVNRDQYRSFELFRRNIVTPEILTFDELYERAKFIAHSGET